MVADNMPLLCHSHDKLGLTLDIRTRNEKCRWNAFFLKRVRSTRVKVEEVQEGVRSHTAIDLVYMADLKYESVLRQIREKITEYEIDGVMDSGILEQLAEKKTILFITTSAVNPSLHCFVNMFYAQAFKQLFEYAENCPEGTLPVPVHVLCDDFATGGRVLDFAEYISIFREGHLRHAAAAIREPAGGDVRQRERHHHHQQLRFLYLSGWDGSENGAEHQPAAKRAA